MKLFILTQTLDQKDPFLGFFHGWVEAFAKRFDEVHVACLQEGFHELPQNVFVYSLGKESGKGRLTYLWRFYTYFTHIFFRVRIDYVFFHMGAIYNILALPFFMLRRFPGTKFYWWKAHGHINHVGRLALCGVDRVYTASEESFPIQSKKRFVVGHAIDTSRVIPPRTPRHGLIRLFTTGRIAPVKSIDVLVRAFLLLKEKGVPVSFVAYGAPAIEKDRWYEAELHTLLTQGGIDPKSVFPGPVPHAILPEKRSNADYFIHSSKTGSMDKNVLDAIISGLIPFTSSAAYGSLFVGFEGMLLYPEGDPEALAEQIERIEKLSEVEREEIRRTLYERVVRTHSLETLCDRLFPGTVRMTES